MNIKLKTHFILMSNIYRRKTFYCLNNLIAHRTKINMCTVVSYQETCPGKWTMASALCPCSFEKNVFHFKPTRLMCICGLYSWKWYFRVVACVTFFSSVSVFLNLYQPGRWNSSWNLWSKKHLRLPWQRMLKPCQHFICRFWAQENIVYIDVHLYGWMCF